MNIDTATVRRLRDALLAWGAAAGDPSGRVGDRPAGRGQQASFERVAPFVETMYLVMMVDGRAEVREELALRGALLTLTDGLLESALLDELLLHCRQLAADFGAETRLQSIGGRICANRMDRELAFTLAAAVALADDTVATEETLILNSIAEWFGVSDRRRRELLQPFETRG